MEKFTYEKTFTRIQWIYFILIITFNLYFSFTTLFILSWSKILQPDLASFDKLLKKTNASFFQYPYYAEGYKYIFLSRPSYFKYIVNDEICAFCTIMEIGIWPFKAGLIIRGPVIIDKTIYIDDVLNSLKALAKKNGYMFLRINPNDWDVDKYLKSNDEFINEDYFPYYKGSQNCNFNIHAKPDNTLLESFHKQCRLKIKRAEAFDFTYKIVENETELEAVYDLFKKVGSQKNFKYRSYKSYREIFKNGQHENLCSVYIALLKNKIVSAVFIVKDKNYYTNLSGGLIVEGYNSHKSPSAKLHYMAMKDCFNIEIKSFYNISYSGPPSGVHEFKSSFNPVVEVMPGYYSFISNKKTTALFRFLSTKNVKKVRNLVRSITK